MHALLTNSSNDESTRQNKWLKASANEEKDKSTTYRHAHVHISNDGWAFAHLIFGAPDTYGSFPDRAR